MPQRLRQLAALHLTAFAFAAALVLLTRAKLFSESSGGARSFSLLFVALTAVSGWTLEWDRRSARLELVERLAVGLVLVLGPSLAALIGLTIGGSVVSFLVGLGIVVAVSGWSLRCVIADLLRELSSTASPSASTVCEQAATCPMPRFMPAAHSVASPRPVQSWVRSVTDDVESIEAELQVSFASGERQAFVHLPIQPAFPTMPEVECEPVEDSDLEVQVDLVTPFGVRLQVRRARTTGPLRAAIAVMLTSTASDTAEAA